MRGIPQDRVTTSMTINAPASVLLLLYELAAERKGIAAAHARGNDPERHPQGVRGPRDVHLSAATVDAARHRHLRVLRGAAAPLEHDQHQRVPHPRGGRDRAAGDRLHAEQRDRVRAGGDRRRARRRRLRAAAELLLQRQQRFLRGGRQVPRGTRALGGGDARALRRARASAACSCASTRRRAARRSPRSSRSTTSCASRCRRWPRCAAARSRCTPTATTRRSRCPSEQAAEIALRTQQVIGHETGRRQRHRSARRIPPRRVAHARAHGRSRAR